MGLRWTDREWKCIAEYMHANGVKSTKYRDFWPTLFQAQARVLEEARRRPHDSLRTPFTKKFLEQAFASLEYTEKLQAQSKPEEPKHPPLSEIPTDQLVLELMHRFQKHFLTPMIVANPGSTPGPVTIHDVFAFSQQGRSQHVPHKTRILVVGPRNGQQKELIDAHGSRLDLRFVSSEEQPSRIQERGKGCDGVLVWVNHIPHEHSVHAKQLGLRVQNVSGGMKALREVLNVVH